MSRDSVLARKIQEKLRPISADQLQVIAEEMAKTAFPTRFSNAILTTQGRNIDSQTTVGWPDAYVMNGKNTVHGIEATRQKNWKQHLEEDLAKAEDIDHFNLSSYFFIGGVNGDEMTANELQTYRTRFQKLGVASEDVTILVGQALAMALTSPKYARILQTRLSIPSSLKTLRLIDGNPFNVGDLQPTKEDYESKIVHHPALMSSVQNELKTSGCALIRGHGACGKTTLAQLIGLDTSESELPVYYFDFTALSGGVSISEVMNDVVAVCVDGTTVILDNIHLNENGAVQLQQHWSTFCKESKGRLLLMGREVRHASGSKLGKLQPMMLMAGHAELRGVLARLAARQEKLLPEIDVNTLNNWTEVFGGRRRDGNKAVDLIAFSAAASNRLSNIAKGKLTLTAEDAVQEMRERYLQPLSSDESANLLRLASFAEFEIPLPNEALFHPDVGLKHSSEKLGIVFSDTYGKSRKAFSLVHSALGTLLLATKTDPHKFARTERLAVTKQGPYLGLRLLAAELEDSERKELLVNLKGVLNISDLWLQSCVTLQDVTWAAMAALRYNLVKPAYLDLQLNSSLIFHKRIEYEQSLESINRFTSQFKEKSLLECRNRAYDPNMPSLIQAMLTASSSELLGYLSAHGNAVQMLNKIDLSNWEKQRKNQSPGRISTTVSLALKIESMKRIDLLPALIGNMIGSLQEEHLHNADLAHVSQLVRLWKSNDSTLKAFVSWCASRSIFEQLCKKTSSGKFCGALMSWSNYMPDGLRLVILNDLVASRVESECANSKKHKEVALSICIVGAYTSLGGSIDQIDTCRWPDAVSFSDIYTARLPKSDTREIGMYELQFWLGLKALYEVDRAPAFVDAVAANRALERLEATLPPTEIASKNKCDLVFWMKARQTMAWCMTKTSDSK